jgi:putative acetyltransferase
MNDPLIAMHANLSVRAEMADDIIGIRVVQTAAFPSQAEADLVDRLREDRSAVLSLVAVLEQRVVGHAIFSRMKTPSGALCLGPVGVLASHRRQGVAARLIRKGLFAAKAGGWASVFVLGNPAYYHRFGFDASLAMGFSSPYSGPHLMALELQADALAVREGCLQYPPAFADLA